MFKIIGESEQFIVHIVAADVAGDRPLFGVDMPTRASPRCRHRDLQAYLPAAKSKF